MAEVTEVPADVRAAHELQVKTNLHAAHSPAFTYDQFVEAVDGLGAEWIRDQASGLGDQLAAQNAALSKDILKKATFSDVAPSALLTSAVRNYTPNPNYSDLLTTTQTDRMFSPNVPSIIPGPSKKLHRMINHNDTKPLFYSSSNPTLDEIRSLQSQSGTFAHPPPAVPTTTLEFMTYKAFHIDVDARGYTAQEKARVQAFDRAESKPQNSLLPQPWEKTMFCDTREKVSGRKPIVPVPLLNNLYSDMKEPPKQNLATLGVTLISPHVSQLINSTQSKEVAHDFMSLNPHAAATYNDIMTRMILLQTTIMNIYLQLNEQRHFVCYPDPKNLDDKTPPPNPFANLNKDELTARAKEQAALKNTLTKALAAMQFLSKQYMHTVPGTVTLDATIKRIAHIRAYMPLNEQWLANRRVDTDHYSLDQVPWCSSALTKMKTNWLKSTGGKHSRLAAASAHLHAHPGGRLPNPLKRGVEVAIGKELTDHPKKKRDTPV